MYCDLLAGHEREVARHAGVDAIPRHAPLFVDLHVGLGDRVLFRLPGGLVEGEGLVLRRALACRLHAAIFLLQDLDLDRVAHLEVRVAGEGDQDVVQHSARPSPSGREIR